MPRHDDVGIQIAREAAAEGLSRFQAIRDGYEKSPNPDARSGPVGGIPLPGMGQGPRSPTPAPPRAPGAPGTRPRSGRVPGARPGPPKPGAPRKGGASPHEVERWRKEAEAIAVKAMLDARADFIPNLFKGAQVRYKSGENPKRAALKAAKDLAGEATETADATKKSVDAGHRWTAGSAPNKSVGSESVRDVRGVGKKVFMTLGELSAGEFEALEYIITDMVGDIFTDLGTTVLPVIGTAKTGMTAGSKWAKTGMTQHKVSRTGKTREQVIQGDPERAVASVKRLLERERNVLATEAGMATAKLGADVAGYFVDLGIASGIATSAAEAAGKLTLQIRLIVRDAREKRAANELLSGPKLDSDLFERCPLLGAYAVAGSSTSDLVGFLGGDPQRDGFTLDDLERIIEKHRKPLIKDATDLISKSRLEVSGMTTDLASARMKAQRGKQMSVSKIADEVGRKLKLKIRRA